MLFATKHYDNPHCENMDEFYEDLNRIKYIKRLLRKYKKTGILRERLILNHLIILQNVFGPVVSELKTFFIFLNYLPDRIPEVDLDKIPLDNKIISTLRKI